MNRKYRSTLAKLRCGILPLEIETGRWSSTDLDKRLCKMCDQGVLEDEAHFMFTCSKYNTERQAFLTEILDVNPNFEYLDIENKWKTLMSPQNVPRTAKYVWVIYDKRQNLMFN